MDKQVISTDELEEIMLLAKKVDGAISAGNYVTAAREAEKLHNDAVSLFVKSVIKSDEV